MESILDKAVKNNAYWCELVCKSQRFTGEFLKMIWINNGKLPAYYPNAITLEPININNNDKVIYRLIDSVTEKGISVKDSFADLELSTRNFSILFNAKWISYTDLDFVTPTDFTGWKIIKNKDDYALWNKSWKRHNEQGEEFATTLLYDKDIHFLGKFRSKEIVAGAILSKSNSVFGLSNVFSSPNVSLSIYSDIICLTRKKITLLPLVGYAQKGDLESALKAGFKGIGSLRVWTKE